jgi:Domain of unknown function (DUF4159)
MFHRGPGVAVLTVALLLIALTGVWAQGYRVVEGPGVPVRNPPKNFEDGAFTACKLMYTSNRREPGGTGWSTDYPFAAINLMTRLSELTKVRVSHDKSREVNYWVVRATDPELFECPFLIGSDVGTLTFSDDEVRSLREYLLKGGFLWVDDFWGTRAWEQWSQEIQRVLPEFPIFDVPADHPIRNALFSVDEVVQVSNINFWRRNGGNTAERGTDSPHADFRAIADASGRIVVIMTHNTDIGDSMEREGEDADFFESFSPRGYALVSDIVLYALTH